MARFRRLREEEGFSMIELMVVVLIIAILIGIAVPTFLGMRQRAQDRAAQTSVILGLKTAKAIAVNDPVDTFATVSTAGLNAAEPSVVFLDGAVASASANQISTTIPDAGAGDQIFVAAVRSVSGACFYGRAFSNGGADFARVDGADCTANNHAAAVFASSW